VRGCSALPRRGGPRRPQRTYRIADDPRIPPGQSVTAFDLPVLLRPSWPDVAMFNPERLDREHKGKRELASVVTLQLPDPEGERPAELGQEREAGALVQPAIQPQDPEARAVVERGVLKGPTPGDLYELHVDLDRFARLGLLEEFHLARRSFAGSPQPG